jgi:hypothetical protein
MELRTNTAAPEIPEENQIFGETVKMLYGTGLALMIIFFLGFLLGLPPSMVNPVTCSLNWHKPLAEYLSAVGSPSGWRWNSASPGSDTLIFASLVFILSVSGLSYLRLIPVLGKKIRGIMVLLIILQIGVLVLSASGLLHPR